MDPLMQNNPFGTTAQSRPNPSDAEFEALLNKERGDLRGYDCPVCLNRGFIWHVEDGEKWTEPCKCRNIRASMARLRKSGLEAASELCTFARFRADEDWQQDMLRTAKAFLADKNRRWMFVSGQSGCGKTHICTATAVRLLKAGAKTRYMQWTTAARELQASIFNDEAYEQKVNPLKTAKVVYIDDLFKTPGNVPPSDKDFRLAFEILNARYNDPQLITIISTEHSLNALSKMDTALAGRIAERCGQYCVQIAAKPGRNYREKFLRREV